MVKNTRAKYQRIPAFNGLVAFEAVARHGSFSKAADELSITQSAVSHRISQLETSIGVSLFLRAGHSVSLSAQGSALLPYVQQGLDSLREGMAGLPEQQRTTRLSMAPGIASNWLVQRLATFQRLHPDINLDIEVTSREVNIAAGEADVGIRFGRGDWEGLEATELIRPRIIPVCSPAYRKAHPWLKEPGDLERATLLRQTTIPWKPWFDAAGLPWDEPLVGPSFSEVSLLIDAVEYSHGVALVLDVLVEKQLQDKTLVRLFDVELAPERAFYIVAPAAGKRHPDSKALIDWLETLRQETGPSPEGDENTS